MPFKKHHKLGFLPQEDEPLDQKPLSVKLRIGARSKVRAIPDWQNKLRTLIDKWIEESISLK